MAYPSILPRVSETLKTWNYFLLNLNLINFISMKSLSHIILAAFILSVLGCDYVNKPTSGGPTKTTLVDSTIIPRKVLVEDYTGHECGNCPAAAIKAQALEDQYHSNIVVLAVHAGFFAQPAAAPFTDDFRNTAGNDWDGFFGIGAAGNPNGMINRKDFPTGTHIKGYNSWATETAPYINTPADAQIKITPTYNAAARTLNVSVKTKYLKALSNNYKLSVVLMEDSILGTQKDYTQNPAIVNNYLFRHMLRGSINGSWGEALNAAPVAAKDSVIKTYSTFAVDPTYNDVHLYVVAFVYNAATYEVIQAEEIKIR
jgi:hypothetical protein